MISAATPAGDTRLSRRWAIALLAVPVLVAAAVAGIQWPEASPDPIDIASNAPTFSTLDELVAASDLIVIGTVESSQPGRTITDPTDPTTGITTTLYQIQITETLGGEAPDPLIVEHETALTNRTPITIDGAPPPQVGTKVLLFLLAGTDPTFPHHAIINHQAHYQIDGTNLRSLSTDPLSQRIASLTAPEAAAQLSTS